MIEKRKTVRKLLVDCDLKEKELANIMGVNYHALSRALTGYLKTPGSIAILNDAENELLKRLQNRQ